MNIHLIIAVVIVSMLVIMLASDAPEPCAKRGVARHIAKRAPNAIEVALENAYGTDERVDIQQAVDGMRGRHCATTQSTQLQRAIDGFGETY